MNEQRIPRMNEQRIHKMNEQRRLISVQKTSRELIDQQRSESSAVILCLTGKQVNDGYMSKLNGTQTGKQKGLGSIPLRLSSLFKKVVVCGQSCDFVPHNVND